MDIKKNIRSFFDRKKYWYFLPKKIRFLIWNLKYLKKFKTKTGYYYLPFFAFKDRIRNKIIDNKISDEKVYNIIKNLVKADSIVLDVGANYGQLSILWSQCKANVTVYAFEASTYIFSILSKNVSVNSVNVKPINSFVGNFSKKKNRLCGYIKKN